MSRRAPSRSAYPRDGTNGRNGTAQPGTYSCPEGQYVAAFTVGEQGGVTLDCRPMPLLPSALR